MSENKKYDEIISRLDLLSQRIENIVYSGTAVVHQNDSSTFNEWTIRFFELFKEGKIVEYTIYNMQLLLKKYVMPLWANTPIRNITGICIQELINTIEFSSVRERLYKMLKDIFTKAYNFKIINSNPFDILRKPTHDEKETRVFGNDEQKIILKWINTVKHNLALVIMFYAGLRPSEVLALTYSDIYYNDRNVIRVNKMMDRQGNICPRTKSAKGEREVPIFDNLTKYLIMFKEKNSNERIFSIQLRALSDRYKSLLIVTKLNNQGYVLYSLRHTCNQNWLDAGVSDKIRSLWMGHNEDVNITKYSHVTDENIGIEVDKYSTYLKQKP